MNGLPQLQCRPSPWAKGSWAWPVESISPWSTRGVFDSQAKLMFLTTNFPTLGTHKGTSPNSDPHQGAPRQEHQQSLQRRNLQQGQPADAGPGTHATLRGLNRVGVALGLPHSPCHLCLHPHSVGQVVASPSPHLCRLISKARKCSAWWQEARGTISESPEH